MLRRRLRQDITNWKVLGRLLPAIVVALLVSWCCRPAGRAPLAIPLPPPSRWCRGTSSKSRPKGSTPTIPTVATTAGHGRDEVVACPSGAQWHHGPAALYMGTNRDYRCFSFQDLAQAVAQAGVTLPVNIFPYPPPQASQDLCTASPSDLSMQAEIWKWTPPASGTLDPSAPNGGGNWTRIFQSPDTIPNPDFPGKFVPYRDRFPRYGHLRRRGRDRDPLRGGVTTQAMWKGKVPPPRILYTKTGNTATGPRCPRTPIPSWGTSASPATARWCHSTTSCSPSTAASTATAPSSALATHPREQRLGRGDPAQRHLFRDLLPWNGYMYAGTQEQTGFRVVKSRGTGSYPFDDWTTVLHQAATPPRSASRS